MMAPNVSVIFSSVAIRIESVRSRQARAPQAAPNVSSCTFCTDAKITETTPAPLRKASVLTGTAWSAAVTRGALVLSCLSKYCLTVEKRRTALVIMVARAGRSVASGAHNLAT